MAKRVVITSPYPTAEEVAKLLGVSKKRLKKIIKMIDKIIDERDKKK